MNDFFPFISVNFATDAAEVKGTTQFSRGYRMPTADGHDDGIFAEWNWGNERLHARCDWLGTQPLFYGEHDRTIVVSTSVVRIIQAGIPADLDLTALGVFFRLGFFLGNDTAFKRIKAFPPNGSLIASKDGVAVTGKYPEYGEQRLTEEQEKEGYLELFRASIERRLPMHGAFIQPLSGGRDSRHIMGELVRQGRPPEFAYTIQTNNRRSDVSEERIAAEVAQRLGVKHRVLQHPVRNEVQRESLKNILTSFTSDEGAWMLGALQTLGCQPEAIYDGYLGDVLGAFHWADRMLPAYRGGGRNAVVEAILSRFSRNEANADKLLDKQFGAAPEVSREATKARISAFFQVFEQRHNPITNFFIFSRGRREIAMSTWGSYPFMRKIMAPFIDRELFAFLISLPERIEPTYAAQRSAAIAAAFPSIGNLPYAQSSKPNRSAALIRRCKLLLESTSRSNARAGIELNEARRWALASLTGGGRNPLKLPRFVYLQGLAAVQQGRAPELLEWAGAFLPVLREANAHSRPEAV
jgi:hypothetical protein